MMQKGSERCCSFRTIISIFLLLTAFVAVSMLYSNSKLSYMTDITVRMKAWGGDDAWKRLRDLQSLNGTFIMKTFFSEEEQKKDKSDWLARNNISNPDATEAPVSAKQDIYGNDLKKNISNGPRKDECVACFKHEFKYLIDTERICKLYNASQTIDLIIVILTVHGNREQRNTLRKTWLTPTKQNTANVRYAFLLGETRDEKQRQAIEGESQQHGDIIQEDFVDSYANLTYKTIMGMKWASTKCSVAKYLMKTDDDMYVNIANILKYVATQGQVLSYSIAGACHKQAGPIRDTKSKWFASIRSYPGKHYPGFCSGTGYITSLEVAGKIYKISPNVPFFHLEDVYVAICIRKLGLTLTPVAGFNAGRPKLDPCVFKGDKFYTGHYMSNLMITRMWNGVCRHR